MKKKFLWVLAAAIILSLLVGWLQMGWGRQVLPSTLLLVAAFVLGWLAPDQSWLTALILAAGRPVLHYAWINLHPNSTAPFSWVGDLVIPVVLCFPSAFFGSALGWMHTIVKDDF